MECYKSGIGQYRVLQIRHKGSIECCVAGPVLYKTVQNSLIAQ